jgi:hypothetical protein
MKFDGNTKTIFYLTEILIRVIDKTNTSKKSKGDYTGTGNQNR